MEIAHAFFARWAETSHDNTISTIGAGFDVVRATKFPTAFPLTVVIKLTSVEADLKGMAPDNLELLIDIAGPEGANVIPHLKMSLQGKHIPSKFSATRQGTAVLVTHLGLFPIMKEGRYEFRITARLPGENPPDVSKILVLYAEVTDGSD